MGYASDGVLEMGRWPTPRLPPTVYCPLTNPELVLDASMFAPKLVGE